MSASVLRDRWWMRAAALAAVASASVFVTVRLARAVPGGPVGSTLSFAGTLTGVSGAQTLTFDFRSGATALCSPSVTVTPRADGSFRAAIPLGACPRRLLDGRDVTFDVRVGSRTVASNQSVSTVPYVRYASAVGTPLCPTGYEPSSVGRAHCRRALADGGFDEVVRVGAGSTAFWIDRFEASLAAQPDGGGDRYATLAALPGGFPVTGNYTTPVYAFSRRGVAPFGEASWFLSEEACRLSGKRLPTSAEWITAARGTPAVGDCALTAAARRATGAAVTCVSAWGAEDMVGNVGEFSAGWQASAFDTGTAAVAGFGADYGNGDVSVAVTGAVYHRAPTASASSVVAGLPAVVAHGLPYTAVTSASGVLSMGANTAPSYYQNGGLGFRCVTAR